MFKTVLIANRGEIAVRAIRTLKKMGVTSIAVYSETDRYAQHVIDADIAVSLEGTKPSDTYLSIEKLIAAAKNTGAEAIFPGYGFLSESADFARACEENNIAFMGPTAEQILEFNPDLKNFIKLIFIPPILRQRICRCCGINICFYIAICFRKFH